MGSKAFLDTNSSSVVEGDNVTFDCVAVGCPPPSIIWQFLDEHGTITVIGVTVDVEIQSPIANSTASKSMLTIKNIGRSQAGMYRCRANNGVGKKSFSSRAMVNVYCMLLYLFPLVRLSLTVSVCIQTCLPFLSPRIWKLMKERVFSCLVLLKAILCCLW